MALLEDPNRLPCAPALSPSLADLAQAVVAATDDAQRLAALLQLAAVQLDADDPESACASAMQATTLAQARGEAAALAEALCLQAHALLDAGLDSPAFDPAALALAQARGSGDVRLQARALGLLGRCQLAAGDATQAEQLLHDSLDHAAAAADAAGRLRALLALAALPASPSGPDPRVQAARQALELAQHAQDARWRARALRALARAQFDAGQTEAAAESLGAAAAAARTLDWPAMAAQVRLDQAQSRLVQGQAPQALDVLQPFASQDDAAAATVASLAAARHAVLHAVHKALDEPRQALAQLELLLAQQRARAQEDNRRQLRLLMARLDAEQALSRAELARVDAQLQAERRRALEREAELLRRHATEDALTGLGNRNAADAALRLRLTRTPEAPAMLVRIDIDHFRAVNELQGHGIGDAVLRAFGNLLRDLLREADEVFRLPGEGFLVLLSEVTPATALDACERLRRAVQGHGWDRVATGVQLTASLGLAGRLDGDDAAAWLARADTALYAARRGGGNRVVAAG